MSTFETKQPSGQTIITTTTTTIRKKSSLPPIVIAKPKVYMDKFVQATAIIDRVVNELSKGSPPRVSEPPKGLTRERTTPMMWAMQELKERKMNKMVKIRNRDGTFEYVNTDTMEVHPVLNVMSIIEFMTSDFPEEARKLMRI